jgi:hypothetical protein
MQRTTPLTASVPVSLSEDEVLLVIELIVLELPEIAGDRFLIGQQVVNYFPEHEADVQRVLSRIECECKRASDLVDSLIQDYWC